MTMALFACEMVRALKSAPEGVRTTAPSPASPAVHAAIFCGPG